MRPAFARPILPGTKFHHIASQVYHLPLLGADPNVDNLIARGELRDVETVTLADGKQIRVARSKGVTYRRIEAKRKRLGFLRRQARKGLTFPNRPVMPLRDAVFD